MKKIISVLALCALFCSGLFALESPNRPIRIEAEYVPLVGIDVKGVYTFRINDVLRWDIGLDVNTINPGLLTSLAASGTIEFGTSTEVGRSINILAVGSFCFWDFYTSYGVGVGINTAGGAAFLPFDLRIGWEPGFRKDRMWGFKLETGLFGNTYGAKVYEYDGNSKGALLRTDKAKYIVSPKIAAGAVFRL